MPRVMDVTLVEGTGTGCLVLFWEVMKLKVHVFTFSFLLGFGLVCFVGPNSALWMERHLLPGYSDSCLFFLLESLFFCAQVSCCFSR